MVVRTISTGSPHPPYPVFDRDAAPPQVEPPLDSPDSLRSERMSRPASLPEALRVAAEPKRPVSAGGRKSFDFPDSLRPGANVPSEPLRRTSEAERKDEIFISRSAFSSAKESEKEKDGPEVPKVLGEKSVVKQETPRSDSCESFYFSSLYSLFAGADGCTIRRLTSFSPVQPRHRPKCPQRFCQEIDHLPNSLCSLTPRFPRFPVHHHPRLNLNR